MLRFKTEGFAGCAVAYSPFLDNRIAVGGASNYGLVGNGRLFILNIAPDATLVPARTFDTQDSIIALAWSETNENQVVVANGDGKLRLFDLTTPQSFPVQAYGEHHRDVFTVGWGLVDKSVFCSGSWDGTIKIWDPLRPSSVSTLMEPYTGSAEQQPAVYSAKFAPHSATSILSGHGNGHARVWDTRAGSPSAVISAVRDHDCLTVDWNKYRPEVVATAGGDKLIRVWDLRNLSTPANIFAGHQYSVKCVKWSPHNATHLLSTSFDMTAKVWADTAAPHIPQVGPKGLVRDFTAHTEFVIDGDWSLWGEPGWVATVGWDQMTYLWKGF